MTTALSSATQVTAPLASVQVTSVSLNHDGSADVAFSGFDALGHVLFARQVAVLTEAQVAPALQGQTPDKFTAALETLLAQLIVSGGALPPSAAATVP